MSKKEAAKPEISPEVQARIDARKRANEAKREAARKNRAAKGVQVEPGMTWQDLTPEERAQHFANHENGWKNRYNQQQAARKAGKQGYQTIERGDPMSVKI